MTERSATGHSSYPHLSSPAPGHSSCPHKFPQQLDTLAIRTKFSVSDGRKSSNWTLQLSALEFPSTEPAKVTPALAIRTGSLGTGHSGYPHKPFHDRKSSSWTLQLSAPKFPSTWTLQLSAQVPSATGHSGYGHTSYPHKSSQALNVPRSFPCPGYPHWFPRHLDLLAIRTGLSMTESPAAGHSNYPHLSSPASGHTISPHQFPQQLDTLAVRTKFAVASKPSNWTLQLSAQEFPSTPWAMA